MHGCANSVLVYGFNIGDREYIIDYKYLEDKFPGISEYASDVIRNCMGEAIYGISCALDMKTGQAIISDEDKDKVKNLYDKYVETMKIDLTQKDFKKKMKKIKLGFHLAVSGDYETFKERIILDEEEEEEEDKKNLCTSEQELIEMGI